MRVIDALGDWLMEHMTGRNQLRLGIICVLASIPLWIYGPLSGEQILIYEMSAAALTLTGIGLVIGAQVMLKQEDN